MNSRIEELNRVAMLVEDDDDQAEFLCECSRSECSERLALDVDDYAELHSLPGRFVLVPGHEVAEVDRVIVRRDDCVVVCKPDAPPAQ